VTLDARQREKEVMRSHAYVGSALPVSDKVTLMASYSARGEFGLWLCIDRLGCRILFDVICVDIDFGTFVSILAHLNAFTATVSESVSFESSLSLVLFARLGSSLSTVEFASIGSSQPTFGSVALSGDLSAIRETALQFSLSVEGSTSGRGSLSIAGATILGSSLTLRCFARLADSTNLSVRGSGIFGSDLSAICRACLGSVVALSMIEVSLLGSSMSGRFFCTVGIGSVSL
jgi:hypothetical protein